MTEISEKSEKKEAAEKSASSKASVNEPADALPADKESVKKKKRTKKKVITDGRIYIHASYNNTIVTITDSRGNPALWASAGNCGFKGTRKSTPYAAQITAEKAIEKAKILGLERAKIYIKGTGLGRDQALRAVAASTIDLQSITDLTSIPFGGCRPKKPRRV